MTMDQVGPNVTQLGRSTSRTPNYDEHDLERIVLDEIRSCNIDFGLCARGRNQESWVNLRFAGGFTSTWSVLLQLSQGQ